MLTLLQTGQICFQFLGEWSGCAVESVSDDGVADGRHVNANLMSASGLDAHLNEGEFAKTRTEAADDFVVRYGGPGIFSRARGHAGAAHRVTAQGCGDGAFLALDLSLHKGDIGLANLARRKKFTESGVRGVVFGDDDEAAGVFVEAVYDPGAEIASG